MNIRLLTSIGLTLAMAACVSTPVTNPALENARTVVQSAEADPTVLQYAALNLETAKQELADAESAALQHDDARVMQSSYLASQTARLAQLVASAKADDARVASGQQERDRIQLAARNREVEDANAAAAQAAANAASLQAQADALRAKRH